MKKEKPDHYRSIDDLNENKKLMKQFGGRQIPEEIRNFDVVLQDPNHVYFSGDTIHGKVLVELDGCVTVQGIIVRLVGEAYVNVPEESGQWEQLRRVTRLRRNKIPSSIPESLCEDSYPETPEDDCCKQWGKNPPAPSLQRPRRARNTKKERQAAKFRSYEKYFEHKLFVFGHKYSSQREQLWAGSHCFPFDYTLPTKLPASFHGRFGYVRYFCEASLERSTSPSICCRAYFSVSCIADVNTDPKAESGASEQKSTNSFLFCCRKGTVIVSASIKRRGFVPGEEVLVSADILNMSNRPVRRSCAKLRQVVTYFSNKGFRNYVSEGSVSEASRGPVPIGESDTWYRVRLPVPSIPPTSRFTNCCKLMDIDYRLNFVVEMVGEPEPLELHLPLVIGTVPLHKRFPYLMTSQALEELGTRTQRMPGAVHVKFSDLPGLMSEQCVWGPRPVETYYSQQVFRGKDPATVGLSGSRSRTRDKIFAPRYVVYRLGRQDKYDGQGDLVIKSAIEIPQIIITRPGAGVCYRHHHVKKGPERRHSAPGHLVVLRAEHPLEHVPLEPLTDIPEVRETHKTSPYKVLC